MKIRGMIWVGMMVLPFLASGTLADSLRVLDTGTANALPSPAQSDSLDGSSVAFGAMTLFEGNAFANRMAFSANNAANPPCRRLLWQSGITPIPCGNTAGGFPAFGGRPTFFPGNGGPITPDPGLQNQTTSVPEPSSLLLLAAGLLGGMVCLRPLMAR